MTEMQSYIKDSTIDYKLRTGILKKEYCSYETEKKLKNLSKSDQPLPDGIHADESGDHYKLVNTVLPDTEIEEYLKYKQIDLLIRQTASISAIEKYMIFFVVLSVVAVVGGLIFALIGLGLI